MEADLFFQTTLNCSTNDINCSSKQFSSSFFDPNWENSVDHNDPFESTLSSIVSSPVASNAGNITGGADGVLISEVIGKLGNGYNSDNNFSTNTSSYSTPLNSPPKPNFPMIDPQILRNFPISETQFSFHQNSFLEQPFLADPGFAERAVRGSCFGLNPIEVACDTIPSNQSLLSEIGFQMGVEESKKSSMQYWNSIPDKKINNFLQENGKIGDSREGSSVSAQNPDGELGIKSQSNGDTRKRKWVSEAKPRENPCSTSDKDEAKLGVRQKEESNAKKWKRGNASGIEKDAAKTKAKTEETTTTKPPEPPKDYIHVRARRGQATDSHSLAERARREKISERMKFLRDLVPGCHKVTGKALVLDEIINYVQSLQRQVEYISMKLATICPTTDCKMEALQTKDVFKSSAALPSDFSATQFSHRYQLQQFPSEYGGFSNETETRFSVNSLTAELCRNSAVLKAPVERYREAAPQASSIWENDLQSVVQTRFGQNQPQRHNGSNIDVSQMNVEQ